VAKNLKLCQAQATMSPIPFISTMDIPSSVKVLEMEFMMKEKPSSYQVHSNTSKKPIQSKNQLQSSHLEVKSRDPKLQSQLLLFQDQVLTHTPNSLAKVFQKQCHRNYAQHLRSQVRIMYQAQEHTKTITDQLSTKTHRGLSERALVMIKKRL
jgi:hypothetical protein